VVTSWWSLDGGWRTGGSEATMVEKESRDRGEFVVQRQKSSCDWGWFRDRLVIMATMV